MAKFYGPIGYAVTEETTPGVWEPHISERMYFGELVRNTRRLQTADKLNDNINVSNEISILADPFARENFHLMKYVGFSYTINIQHLLSLVKLLNPRRIHRNVRL